MGGYQQVLTEQAGFVPGPSDQVVGASGAIVIQPGVQLIVNAGVAALTLTQPKAGPPDQGGQDGLTMQFISTTAEAHTITTSAHGINGTDDTATFGGAIGDSITFKAFNGIWLAIALNGVVLSEV